MLGTVILSALLTAKCIPPGTVFSEYFQFERTSVEGPVTAELDEYDPLLLRSTAEGVDTDTLRFRRTQNIQPTRELAKQFARNRRREPHFTCGGRRAGWDPVWPGVYQAVVIADTGGFAFQIMQLEIDADRKHAELSLETEAGPVRIHYRGATAHARGCALAGDDRGPGGLGVVLFAIVLLRRRT